MLVRRFFLILLILKLFESEACKQVTVLRTWKVTLSGTKEMVQIRRQQTRITSGRLSHLNDFINGSNQDVWRLWRGEGVSRVWSVVHWHEAGRTEDSLPSWLSPLTSQSCPLLYFYFTFLRRRTPPTSELDKRKNVTQQTNPANSVPGQALQISCVPVSNITLVACCLLRPKL